MSNIRTKQEIGQAIRDLMEQHGHTQAELEALSGVRQRTISRLCLMIGVQMRHPWVTHSLRSIARAYNLPSDALLPVRTLDLNGMSAHDACRQKRMQIGLLQKEVAAQAGISLSAYGRYEIGDYKLPDAVLLRLEKILDLKLLIVAEDADDDEDDAEPILNRPPTEAGITAVVGGV